MRRSLSADLVRTAAASLVVAALVALAMWAAFVRLEPAWADRLGLNDSIDHLQDSLVRRPDGQPLISGLSAKHQLMYRVLPQDLIYQFVDPHGAVVVSSNGDVTPLLANARDLQSGRVVSVQRDGVSLRVMAEPAGEAFPGWFIVVGRSSRFQEIARDVSSSWAQQSAVLAVVLSMAIFVVVVLVIVNRLLRRLREASAAAALIAPANLVARLDSDGVPKEVAPLIESFNAALERLEVGFRNQQEFLATAAHELKTPIALLRAQVELDGAIDRAGMLADLDHMSRHVHQLLHLAEVSDGASMSPIRTDVGAVVDDAVRALGRLMSRQGVTVKIDDGGAPALVQADASGLFILVRNLLENAVHHSPPGSVIEVKVSPDGLAVVDQGPGIPAADLPKVFKRFWRGTHRQDDGAGLGLAICHEIALAHGWEITAGNAPTGGAEFEIRFLQTTVSSPVG